MTLQSDPGFPRPRSLLEFPLAGVVVPYADPPGDGGVDRDPFTLSGSVGRNGANARADVIKAQILLANAGYHDLPDPGAPTGWPGGGLERSILRLQKDKGITPDGVLLPLPDGGVGQNGEGETLNILKTGLGGRLDGYLPKFLPSGDANEKSRTKYEESAKDVCRGIMEELKDKMIAHGMLPADGE